MKNTDGWDSKKFPGGSTWFDSPSYVNMGASSKNFIIIEILNGAFKNLNFKLKLLKRI